MNRLILQLLLLPASFWERLGVDTEKLRLILNVKLTLDDRRPRTTLKASPAAKKKNTSGSNILQFIIMIAMGAAFLVYFFFTRDAYVAYFLYFFSLMCVLALMLIADFSTILMDTRDQYIILPRPVDDRTFAVSRILHIGILLLTQIGGLALPGLVYTGIAYGLLPGIIFILQIAVAGILTLLLVNQFYLMMIRWLSARRLKDLIATFQIIFSIAVFSSYYFGPALLRSEWIQQFHIRDAAWSWLLPPVWIASLQQLAIAPLSLLTVALSLLAVIAPAVALWLVIRIFSAGFNDKLAALAGGDERQGQSGTGARHGHTWRSRLAGMLTRTPLESAGFNIVWLLTGRTREFKQKLYPTFAYIPVYFLFMFFVGFGNRGTPGSFEEKLERLRDGGTFLILFYLSLFTLMSVFQLITQSERFNAAWVYRAAPVRAPGAFMSGVLMAVLVRFFFPFILALTLLAIPVTGGAIINDALLAAAIGSIEAMLIALFTMKAYPFSQPPKRPGGNVIATLMIMGFVGMLGYGHYVLLAYEWLVWAACIMAWGAFALMLRYFRKDAWEGLEA